MEDLFSIIEDLFHGIENYHDSYTKKHEVKTGKLMSLLASRIGMDETQCYNLEKTGNIHDIGKLALPSTMLEKVTPLNVFERKVIELHPKIGSELIKKINHPLSELAEKIITAHHECFDGSGYPHGLKGEQIPIEARICSICDVYDALRSYRPYRKKQFTHESIVEKMLSKNENGLYSRFDPELLVEFEKLADQFKKTWDDLTEK